MKILVIEDDIEVSNYIAKGLVESGYVVDQAFSGTDGLYMATSESYDLLIVDRMIPKLDGLNVIRSVRAASIETPIIVLSALGAVTDRVEGLNSGGDDYLTKPFAFIELKARIDALSRRSEKGYADNNVLEVSDLKMDMLSRKVTRADKIISLQPREFRLLAYLVKHKGQVLTRTMLLENVWDYRFDPQTNVIDVHISRLRNKIDKDFDKGLLITVRGAGYMIVAN
ncbi:winged helix-turn-helix domain-containing protein [Thalassotalea ganghwensis]